MKKKLLSMLLAVAMVASLTVGCGGSEEPAAETTETSETTDETAEVPKHLHQNGLITMQESQQSEQKWILKNVKL